MSRVCLLIPWFGRVPVFWPAFVASVAHSRLIDVVVISDCLPPTGLPDNVRCHVSSLAAVRERLCQLLGRDVPLDAPYKLCDYKPMTADLFADYIVGYEFWAYGDIDVIYGQVDDWLAGLLDQYDVISFRRGWLSGSLTVLRNEPRINSLYRSSQMLDQVLGTQTNCYFDEVPGQLLAAAEASAGELYRDAELHTFTALVFREHFAGRLRLHAANMVLEGLGKRRLLCADGQVRDEAGTSYPYYHLVCEKSATRFDCTREIPYPAYINQWGYAAMRWRLPDPQRLVRSLLLAVYRQFGKRLS